jgi:hypothetical protein
MAVGMRVSVGSEVGSGSGVDVKAEMSLTSGVEVAGLAPQAVAKNDKTINADEYDSNFFIGWSSYSTGGAISPFNLKTYPTMYSKKFSK